jgi:hypothetical protein
VKLLETDAVFLIVVLCTPEFTLTVSVMVDVEVNGG